MTVGQKIKRIRLLRGLTQKVLGQRCGFSERTADNRIRQYELDLMVPKADKRERIAEALDVDIVTLSKIDITGRADVMQILFELERDYGLTIHADGDECVLKFAEPGESHRDMRAAVREWLEYRTACFAGNETGDSAIDSAVENTGLHPADRTYQLWTCCYNPDV